MKGVLQRDGYTLISSVTLSFSPGLIVASSGRALPDVSFSALRPLRGRCESKAESSLSESRKTPESCSGFCRLCGGMSSWFKYGQCSQAG